jgi:tetratricopeptide (TPR) repeat protein
MRQLQTSRFIIILIVLTLLTLTPSYTSAQKQYTAEEEQKSERLFKEGNTLMKANNPVEALKKYDEGLKVTPDSAGLLYNGGLAAFQTKDFEKASKYWQDLKKLDPHDWQVRAKLIQAYQSASQTGERDAERKELFELRKSGKVDELNKAEFYCREQTEIDGKPIMVFEHFELIGNRALRYVFYILDAKGKPEYRISLGSYATTVAIWRETTKPTPGPDERLFHLDGYYHWGHATYGMYGKEPTYDQVRDKVKAIVEKEKRPISSTTIVNQPRENTKP